MRRFYAIVLFLFVRSVAAGQDLIIKSVQSPTTFYMGEEFTSTAVVANTGIVATGESRPVDVYAYLSKDDQLGYGDLEVALVTIYNLQPGASQEVSFDKFGMTNYSSFVFDPGVYNLIVAVDRANSINETDEDNNLYVMPNVTILDARSDFVCSFTVDKSAYPQGEKATISYTITNQNVSANVGGLVDIVFYLSNDNVFSKNDVYLGEYSNDFTGPDIGSGVVEVVLQSAALGKYYIIGKANAERSLKETNPSNNTCVVAVDILKPDIDLEITDIASANYHSSAYSSILNVSFTLRNNGTTGVSGFGVKAYLCESPDISSAVAYYAVKFPGRYISGDESITIDGTVGYWEGKITVDKSYYLILEVNSSDSYKVIDETNTSNNTFLYADEIYVADPGVPGVKLTGASFAEAYTNADTQLNMDVTFLNTGTSDYIQSSYNVIITDSNDEPVYSNYSNPFYVYAAPGNSATQSLPLILSKPLAVGEYKVKLVCVGSECNGTPPVQVALTIRPSTYILSGKVAGDNGVPLTEGNLYLYQKDDNNDVKLVRSIALEGQGTFSFPVAGQLYTLYFIPDQATYPDYVPTVFGRTLRVDQNSFIAMTESRVVTLDMLRLAVWPAGNRVIRGVITIEGLGSQVNAGRVEAVSVANIPVLLLSDEGLPVRLTYTDDLGNYMFDKLPAGNYQLFAFMAPDDDVTMLEPVFVDATQTSITVQLNILAGGDATVEAESFYRPQTIAFAAFEDKRYGDAPFSIDATIDSGLPLTFTSSNAVVATVENGNIMIHSAGTADITASQNGDGDFAAAASVTRTLVVANVTGIEPIGNSIRLYPNPTAGLLTIEGSAASDAISITDVLGKQITTVTRSGDGLDLSALPSGIYLLTLQYGSGVKVFRIVKE